MRQRKYDFVFINTIFCQMTFIGQRQQVLRNVLTINQYLDTLRATEVS